MPEKQFLTDKEAAIIAGLATQTLRNWRHNGVGPAYYKIGGSVRYEREAFLKFLQSRKVETANFN